MALIDGLPGNTTSKRVKLLNKSFSIWTDSGNVKKYEVKGTFWCSTFVRRTLTAADIKTPYQMNAGAFANAKNIGTLKIIYEIKLKNSSNTSNTSTTSAVTINVRNPKIGDIIALGDEGNYSTNAAHTGIYLGSGLFISATMYVGPGGILREPTAGYPTNTGGIGIKFVPKIETSGHDKIVYRSPGM